MAMSSWSTLITIYSSTWNKNFRFEATIDYTMTWLNKCANMHTAFRYSFWYVFQHVSRCLIVSSLHLISFLLIRRLIYCNSGQIFSSIFHIFLWRYLIFFQTDIYVQMLNWRLFSFKGLLSYFLEHYCQYIFQIRP